MNDRLDPLILSAASDRWQKVAKIIALASDGVSDPVNVPAIASRIASLVMRASWKPKATFRIGGSARFVGPSRAFKALRGYSNNKKPRGENRGAFL